MIWQRLHEGDRGSGLARPSSAQLLSQDSVPETDKRTCVSQMCVIAGLRRFFKLVAWSDVLIF